MELGYPNTGESSVNIDMEVGKCSSKDTKLTHGTRIEAGEGHKKTVSDVTHIKSDNIATEMSFMNGTTNEIYYPACETNAKVSDNVLAVSEPVTVVHESNYREDPDTKWITGRTASNSKHHENGKLYNDSTPKTIPCDDFESTEVGMLTRHNVKQHTNRHKQAREHNGQTKHNGRRTKHDDMRNINEAAAGVDMTSERVTYCHGDTTIEKHDSQLEVIVEELPINSRRPSQMDTDAQTLDTDTSLANNRLETATINMSVPQCETLSPRTDSSATLCSSLSRDTVDVKNVHQPKRKRIAKKKRKHNIEDVETLVSRDKWLTSDNKHHREGKLEETEAIRNKPVQVNSSSNEDSGIEKDFDDEHDSFGKAHSHNDDDEHDIVQIQSLATSAPKRYTKRPVYDAMNTSTALIMLNNKYGKVMKLNQYLL